MFEITVPKEKYQYPKVKVQVSHFFEFTHKKVEKFHLKAT